MTHSSKLPSQVVGNIGMYYASYRLSLLGWNAMPTARNARGIDILAYDSTCRVKLGIQVKTLSGSPPVPVGTSLEKVMGDFWIVVTRAVEPDPVCYILLPEEVLYLASKSGKASHPSYWINRRDYDQDRYREAWRRIGRGDGM